LVQNSLPEPINSGSNPGQFPAIAGHKTDEEKKRKPLPESRISDL
jgi:hypothetical protein